MGMSSRQWTQLNAPVFHENLIPFKTVLQKIAVLPESDLCNIAEAYIVLSYLTSKGAELELKFDTEAYCYYFTTKMAYDCQNIDKICDVVVPLSASTHHLTPSRLQSLFCVGGILRHSISVGTTDTDGTTI